jgi:cyanate lyase
MDDARARLASEMDKQRVKLRLRWKEVARRAGLTPEYLGYLRRGKGSLTDLAIRGIETALEWPEGQVDAILAGPVLPPSDTKPVDAIESTTDEIGRILARTEELYGKEAADAVLAATNRKRGGDSGELQADYQGK